MTVFIVGEGGGGDADARGDGFAREMQGETPRFEIVGECSDHEYYTTE